MTLRTKAQLLALLSDNNQRAISPEKVRDLVDSLMAVTGTMYGNDQTVDVTTTWQPLVAFTTSIDTYGLQEDLVAGEFIVQSGGDGVFNVDASLGVYSAFAGWLEFAITKNGLLTPFLKKRTLTAGGDGVFDIVGSGNLAEGNTSGIAIRASGNGSVTLTNGQFRLTRV